MMNFISKKPLRHYKSHRKNHMEKKLKEEICEKRVSTKIIKKGKWKFKRTDNCTDAVIICDIHMED